MSSPGGHKFCDRLMSQWGYIMTFWLMIWEWGWKMVRKSGAGAVLDGAAVVWAATGPGGADPRSGFSRDQRGAGGGEVERGREASWKRLGGLKAIICHFLRNILGGWGKIGETQNLKARKKGFASPPFEEGDGVIGRVTQTGGGLDQQGPWLVGWLVGGVPTTHHAARWHLGK